MSEPQNMTLQVAKLLDAYHADLAAVEGDLDRQFQLAIAFQESLSCDAAERLFLVIEDQGRRLDFLTDSEKQTLYEGVRTAIGLVAQDTLASCIRTAVPPDVAQVFISAATEAFKAKLNELFAETLFASAPGGKAGSC